MKKTLLYVTFLALSFSFSYAGECQKYDEMLVNFKEIIKVCSSPCLNKTEECLKSCNIDDHKCIKRCRKNKECIESNCSKELKAKNDLYESCKKEAVANQK